MAFCSSCGADIGDGAFCSSCGAPQNTTGAGATTAPADNLCIRCGAGLQNGTCLSCGWTAPVADTPVSAAAAAPAAAPVTVNVNSSQAGKTVSGPPCPKCGSQSTELAQVKSKKFSGGKIAAGVMTGGLSLLATGVKSKQKVDWVCTVCGNSFTVKS